MVLDQLASPGFSLAGHLLTYFLPRHSDFLIRQKQRVLLNFGGESLVLAQKIFIFVFAFSPQRRYHGLVFLFLPRQPSLVVLNYCLGLLFFGSGLPDCRQHFMVARLEEITNWRQRVTNDDKSKNEKIPEREPDLTNRWRMMLGFRGGSPCLRSGKELEKTHPTSLPRTLLAISCAIVLTSDAANCRSFCIWLSTSRRTPSSILIASSRA